METEVQERVVDRDALVFYAKQHEYIPVELDQQGRLWSEELGVLLHPEDEILRIIDSHTGKAVPSLEEAILWAEQEAQRAEQERQRSERFAAQLRALEIEPERV